MKTSALLLGALALTSCGPAPEPITPAPPVASTAEPSGTPDVGGPKRSGLPQPAARANWTPPTPEIFTLKNGLRVWYSRQGSVPLVSLALVVRRGSATDPAGKAGLTELMMDLLDEGAGDRNALELDEDLQRLATDLGLDTDVDYVSFSMSALAENFEPSVKLLANVVRRPKLNPEEFKRRKEQQVAAALSRESEPQSARRMLVYKTLFADGYAGDLDTGTRSSLEKIQLADVKKQYHDLVAPDGAEFVVVGGIEREIVARALEASFGDWTGKSQAKIRAVAPESSERGIQLVDFPGAAQSVLAVVRRADPAGTPQYFPGEVWNRAFGGAFTSRVNMNLRESKGYTYGAFSTFRRFKSAGYYGIFADVKTDTTRPSLDETFKEIAALCAGRPLAATERDQSVSGLLLGFPGDFEHIADVAHQFMSLPIYDRPVDWFTQWPLRVEKVSLDDANAIATGFCDPAAFAVVIAGDRAKISDSLTSLGRKLAVFDVQGKKLD